MKQTSTQEMKHEDTDSIMTDEVDMEEGAMLGSKDVEQLPGGESDDDQEADDNEDDEEKPVASTSALPISPSSPPRSSPPVSHLYPSTSTATPTTSSATHAIRPSGPVCEFGDRLGYTYFSAPVPTADQLNTMHGHTETYWFTIDMDLTYLSFFRDKGPLNVGCLYRFCLHLHELLESPTLRSKRIILFSSDEPDKKGNAALLMALYAMIVLRWPPADALHPVACLELQPFRDAGYARADFHLSLQDVIFGARKAIDNRLLKLDEFNLQEYEHYEKVENGDWNFITPNFLAFASPMEQGYDESAAKVTPRSSGKQHGASASAMNGLPRVNKAFRNVLEYFEKNNVKLVVRLNKKLYNERRFTDLKIEHREMYFDDGTNPTMEMSREFIDLSERIIRNGGVVAVHCKAGLGRTGTLIGAYLIYKYGFTATEVIGYMRLMRPGTCVGPQQHFMYENQMTWYKWGCIDRYKQENPSILLAVERPITPPTDDEHVGGRSSSIASSSHHISTPRAVTPLPPSTINVPGQPRKTPGAKTRHMVSAPETVDPVNDDVFLDQIETQASQRRHARATSKASSAGGRELSATPSAAEKDEEMQLVVDEVLIIPHVKGSDEGQQPAAYAVSSQGIREITPPTLLDPSSAASSSTITSSANTPTAPSAKTPSSGSRIAKPRPQRPLTTICDNRQVDKIPTLSYNDENEHALPLSNTSRARSGSANGNLPRSKAVNGGLGTVLEDVPQPVYTSNSTASQERYNLRTAKSKEHLRGETHSQTSPPPQLPLSQHGRAHASSPSRLPQRVSGRRRAAAKSGNQLGVGHPEGAAVGSVTVATSHRQTRSVSGSNAAAAAAAQSKGNAQSGTTGPTRNQKQGRRRRSSTGEVA